MIAPAPICRCCQADVPTPNTLMVIRRRTNLKRIPVLLCKRCDGPAYELGQRADNKWFDENNPDNYSAPPETA